MYLNYVIFSEKLAKEAQKNTIKGKSKVMTDIDITNCLEVY